MREPIGCRVAAAGRAAHTDRQASEKLLDHVRTISPASARHRLAGRVERAEIDLCADTGSVGTLAGIASLEAGRPGALRGGRLAIEQDAGAGLTAPVTDADLDAIEAVYAIATTEPATPPGAHPSGSASG
jgi:hypothetical protein